MYNFNYEEEPTMIKLEDVKTENIEKGIEYNIYERKSDEGHIVGVWGENRLIVTDNELHFLIDDFIPFKYYRGTIGLEERTSFYLKELKEYFKEDDSLTINTTCEEQDNHLVYSVDITSTDIDVTKFISKMLGFEFLFETKLKKIEDKINKLLQ